MSRAEIVASGFGLAGMVLAPSASPLLFSINGLLFHQKYSTSPALALLVDFAVLGALCSLVVLGVARIPEGVIRRVAITLLILAALRPARYVFLWWKGTPATWTASRVVVELLSAALVVLALFFAHRFSSTLGKFAFLLPGIGISALLMMLQLVRFAVAADRLAHQPAPICATAFPATALRHRVVWILYDELSYREVFERANPNGLSLPTFQSIRSASVFFRNVVPAGYSTEFAVPSLFLGSSVHDVRVDAPRRESIRLLGKAGYTPFGPEATIFDELHRERLNSAVVGWYMPYCDLFASVVSRCAWESEVPVIGGMSGEQTVLQNALSLARVRFQAIRGHTLVSAADMSAAVLERQRVYSRLMADAVSAIADPTTSLVFIHLPVPHPPGIYDRHTQNLSASGSYLDNLVLADRTLQILLDAIHSSASRDVTALIMSSDHSWRIELWNKDPAWSREDASAAPTSFDPRIPLLVQFPNQNQGVEIDQSFDAIRSRSLIMGILHGQLVTPNAVGLWSDSK
jgi:hypothetical protein